VDWNEDGKKDLITGENNGHIRLYLNTNTDTDPVFSGYTLIQQGGGNYDCGSYSIPHVVDWNNDGMKDLLCGESSGRVYLSLNTGTNASPLFANKTLLKDGSTTLDVGGVSSPTVVDLDMDGKKDLLIGETYGNLFFFQNRGTDAKPKFSGKSALKVDTVKYDCGYYSRPEVVDWNNDGIMDIISGTYIGNVQVIIAKGSLFVKKNWISEKAGGTNNLNLAAGASNANRKYIIVASASGSTPGLPLPGGQAILPVNFDIFTSIVFGLVNSTVFSDFMGILDASGNMQAKFSLPPSTFHISGYIFSFAYALNAPWDFASNPIHIEIVK